MARADKQAAVAEIVESFNESAGAVLTEYRGLTVKQLQDLRRSLGENANYAVVKNTLAKIAATEAGIDGFDDLLTGPTAIAFINGDVVEAAKGLRDFAKANPTLVIKGGVLDGKPLDAKEIAKLADLESREVLMGKLAGAMLASLSQAVYLLNAPLAQAARLAGALQAKAEQDPSILAGGAGTPVAAAAEEAPALPRRPPPTDAAEEAPEATDRGLRRGRGHRGLIPGRRTPPTWSAHVRTEGNATMAKLSTDELLDAFKEMTLIELERVREAVRGHLRRHRRRPGRRCRRPGCRWRRRRRRRGRRRAGRVRRRPRGRRRQEDQRHQGGARAHLPRPEGGQGPRRGRPQGVLEKVTKEAAEKAKEALEGAGATVTLK